MLKKILSEGNVEFEPRTQVWTIGLSAASYTMDMKKGFPLLTTKNIPLRLPAEEVFWKLRGETNVKSLVDRNIHFWTANAFDRYLKIQGLKGEIPKHSTVWNEEFVKYAERIKNDSEFAETAGDLGPVYGNQWRHWVDRNGKEVDQLENLLKGIKENPVSRYHVLNAWNSGDLPEMALRPCPFWHQFTVYPNENAIDLTMVQRSCDTYLGVPFNDAQDALLLEMVAKETGYQPRFFHHHFNNVHIYLGVPPRSDFWGDSEGKVWQDNVFEFQSKFKGIDRRSKYLALRDWYSDQVDDESSGNERKDHLPFVLEQLSKNCRKLPSLYFKQDVPLMDAIEMPALEIFGVKRYNPHKWDAKAEMAA